MEEVKKSVFDASWDMTEDELDAEERELKKSELQRQFEAKYDLAGEKIIKIKRAQQGVIKTKFKNFDIEKYRENRFEIAMLLEAQTELKQMYVEFFGEELKR